jgi:hypothetical protein
VETSKDLDRPVFHIGFTTSSIKKFSIKIFLREEIKFQFRYLTGKVCID